MKIKQLNQELSTMNIVRNGKKARSQKQKNNIIKTPKKEKNMYNFSKISARQNHPPKSRPERSATFLRRQKIQVKFAKKNLEIYQFLNHQLESISNKTV